MTEDPTVHGGDRGELLEDLRSVADAYTESWDPDSDDAGTTLLQIFSRFGGEVADGLDRVPNKHRVAFLDELDFGLRPPQAARLPLTFTTESDIDGNVVVPGGTQATAETADGQTEIFEIESDDGFEATPASLTSVWGVDPSTDRIFDHGSRFDAGESVTLFSGENLQEHVLYLGATDLLNLEAGSTITMRLLTNASEETLESDLVWEYYGEVGEDEPEGWHELPQETTDIVERYDESDVGIEDLQEAVSERIREFSRHGTTEWRNRPFELHFRLPGEPTERSVNGTESRWIRARVAGDTETFFDIEVESVSLNVERSADEGGFLPDELLQNDVPLSLDGDEDVQPFGRLPQPPTTMYLSSEEALTKAGATVEVAFEPPSTDGGGSGDAAAGSDDADESSGRIGGGAVYEGNPEISWEYWNGNGWTRLRLLDETTESFTEPGEVRFTVPEDLETTSVSGHEDHWIRARLVSGNYGQPRYAIGDEGGRGELVERPDPPRFGGVTMGYDRRGEQFEHVVAHNNVSYREITDRDREFAPFEGIESEKQTLYLGFDGQLSEGPITLFFSMTELSFPRSFDPGMRWEYCPDPDRGEWQRLEVRDDTEGLTERGIVSCSFPEPTRPFELFGEERHWLRVRVTRDEFVREFVERPARLRDEAGRIVERRTDPTESTRGSKTPPVVDRIAPNTQWARNLRTVADEVLGSSTGRQGQRFESDHAPVMDLELWVDEVDTLSAQQRRNLATARPDDVDRVPAEAEEPVEFWVRWTAVDDFLDSGDDDRHYRVDRATGTVEFGDGRRGRVPPRGENNLRATYRTGGGSDGNVEAGAVDDLRNPIPLIDSVTNPEPSDGGADVESQETVLSRAPQRIKNRGRAVTPRDFEQVAMARSRELAKVSCEPRLDARGDRQSGWVTLLIVPRERRERPTPSMELRQRVRESVRERAPATLGGTGRQRIVVRGPTYSAVSVDTRVHTGSVESISKLKADVEGALESFLHPLTGGQDGEGWAFGESPLLSQVASLIEAREGVDRVLDVVLSVQAGDEEIRVRDDAAAPSLSRDTLVCSGDHDVTVTMDGREGRRR